MKKDLVTQDNYKSILLKRAIITCWLLLAVCFLIKIFGGNFAEIICEDETFIKICDFLQNNIIIYSVLGYINFIITSIILYFTVTKYNKNFYLYLFIISIYWLLKLFISVENINISPVLYSIIDFGILYIIISLFSKKYFLSLLTVVFMVVFSIVSTFIKTIGLSCQIDDNLVITYIYLIDYYIMILLCMFYSMKTRKNKKEM